jgi:nucleotide-binding universal stress UspA family protein
LDIARKSNALVRLLSVANHHVPQHTAVVAGDTDSTTDILSSEEGGDEQQTALLQSLCDRTEAAGVRVQAILAHGAPAETIGSYDPMVDVIALGHRGTRPSWDKLWMGSVAESVVRASTKPVLVSPAMYRPIRRILIAYDGSEQSMHALRWADRLAGLLPASLVLVHVNRNPQLGEALLEEAKTYVRSERRFHLPAVVREGKAAEEILQAAGELGDVLIVMGAYGHARVRDPLLGSVAEEVMHNTEWPLLLTR